MARQMKTAFIVPVKGKNIVYLPLESKAILLEKTLSPNQLKGILDKFESQGTWTEKSHPYFGARKSMKLSKLNFGICPTLDCNLDCRYCYAHAGKFKNTIDFEMAKTAIDLIVSSRKKAGKSRFYLTFLGGGEPTLHWGLFKKIVLYAREKAEKEGLTPFIAGSSNGVLSEEQATWIAKHFSSIQIAFDALKDLQDRNRPMRGGGSNYEAVLKTIKKFEELKFPYTISTVLPPDDINRMPEVVKALNWIKSGRLKVGPMFCSSKAASLGLERDKSLNFYEEYVKAQKLAKDIKTNMHQSYWKAKQRLCYLDNLYLTPEGLVTTCVKVTSSKDLFADYFILGKLNNKTKKFEFDMKKWRLLAKRPDKTLKECDECFAKFSCLGACAYAALEAGGLFRKPDASHCEMVKRILRNQLADQFRL